MARLGRLATLLENVDAWRQPAAESCPTTLSCRTTAMSYWEAQPNYGNNSVEDPNNLLNTVSQLSSQ